MIPEWLIAIRGRVPAGASIVLGLIPIVLLVLLWWISTAGIPEERVIGPTILPSPAEVVASLRDLLTVTDQDNFSLLDHTWISLRRVVLGFALALALVVPIGILMGAFGSVRAFFDPLVTAGSYIPIATL
ncbi:MAG: hypothetical protein ABIG68_08465, partial [Acidobacteriota bacterium]